jgi:hypothetical protein
LVADAGNLVSEIDESNNEFSAAITVSPREEVDVFESLNDEGMIRAYYFNASTGGLNQLIGIFASGEADPSFYESLFSKLHEGQLGILHYANESESAAFFLQSELTQAEFFSAVEAMIGGDSMAKTELEVNGKDVVFLESTDGVTSLCAWREGGWGKVVMYKRFFPPVVVFNNTVGENTTCIDIISQEYDSSEAHEFLGATTMLASQVNVSGESMLEGVARTGVEKLYTKGFRDGNSAFLLMVSDTGALVPEQCPGTVIEGDNKSVCHMQQASLMQAVEMEAYMRKQGQYTIVVFVAPFSNTNLALARTTALEAVKGIVFPGIEEYEWGSVPPSHMAVCEFPDKFLCTLPTFENSTMNVSITSVSENPLQINGFKCTQEFDAPTPPFAIDPPVVIQPHETIRFTQPCYITGDEVFNGTVMYLRSQLFVNVTDLGTNETELLNGTLVVNLMGGEPRG